MHCSVQIRADAHVQVCFVLFQCIKMGLPIQASCMLVGHERHVLRAYAVLVPYPAGCWMQQKAIADRELRVFVRHVVSGPVLQPCTVSPCAYPCTVTLHCRPLWHTLCISKCCKLFALKCACTSICADKSAHWVTYGSTHVPWHAHAFNALRSTSRINIQPTGVTCAGLFAGL